MNRRGDAELKKGVDRQVERELKVGSWLAGGLDVAGWIEIALKVFASQSLKTLKAEH